MDSQFVTVIIIGVFGLAAMIGAYRNMKPGFGPFNVRIIGIILIGTFSSMLALHNEASLTAAMGILGAIAGYLFGLRDPES